MNAKPPTPEKPAPIPLLPVGDAISSAALLGGRQAVTIVHNGELYRLRQTRQGKLILTK